MFCDWREVAAPALWHTGFYFFTSLGHQAVLIFFVLSGFFVGGSVIRAGESFCWTRYLVARLSRLWTVLIPALLFTAVTDLFLSFVSPEVLQGAYSNLWSSGPRQGEYSASFCTFLSNVFFLQTILTPVFGTNSPLWSLSNEFWYYLAFPAMVSLMYRRSASKAMLLGTFVAALACYLPASLLLGGVIWASGALVFYARRICFAGASCGLWPTSGAAALFGAALAFSRTSVAQVYTPLLADVMVGVTFALLAFCLSKVRFPLAGHAAGLVVWLSEISYTLYLFHFPLVVVVGAQYFAGEQWQPSIWSMPAYLCLLLMLIGFAHVAWILFERNTALVRRAMTLITEPKVSN